MEYGELTEKVIGCAYRVCNKMGFGFLESVCEKCVLIELHKANLDAEPQKSITIYYDNYYDNQIIGEFVADVDVIVNDTVILELKSVRRIIKAHEVQLVNCLVAMGRPVELILNFGERKFDVKRKIKDLN